MLALFIVFRNERDVIKLSAIINFTFKVYRNMLWYDNENYIIIELHDGRCMFL